MRYGRTLSLLRRQLRRVAHASPPLSAAAGAAVAERRGTLGGSGAGAAGGVLVHVRGWAAAASTTEEMPERTFHQAADHILEALQDKVEEYVEDLNLPDSDVEFSMGVLTIRLGEKGTFVINKQAPNRQIWLSSPVSGPVRYDYDSVGGFWFYHRDGHKLHEQLQKELVQLCGGELSLAAV